MADKKSFSDNRHTLLTNEVGGFCPICGRSLFEFKNNKHHKRYQLAHIYPENPTSNEAELLKNVDRFSEDPNDIINLLAVCPNCHTEFDNPRTIKGYNEWYQIKNKLINQNKMKKQYIETPIEEELMIMITSLKSFQLDDIPKIELNYDPEKFNNKIDATIPHIIKKDIQNHIVDYFWFVRGVFQEIDKEKPYTFDAIATQVKLAYIQSLKEGFSKFESYDFLVEWLDSKTQKQSRKSCEIIIAYFIQNCEVFSNDSSK